MSRLTLPKQPPLASQFKDSAEPPSIDYDAKIAATFEPVKVANDLNPGDVCCAIAIVICMLVAFFGLPYPFVSAFALVLLVLVFIFREIRKAHRVLLASLETARQAQLRECYRELARLAGSRIEKSH